MDPTSKLSFLKDEYLLLQKVYEDFDARVITIKGWSATVSLAAIGTGFFQSRYLWLFAAGAAIVFWGIETVWKSFQYMYAPRIEELEKAFRTEQFDKIKPFQIYTSWFAVFEQTGFEFGRIARMPIVFFPHLVTFTVGVGLFLLQHFGILTLLKK